MTTPLTKEERAEILECADNPKKNVLDDDVRRYEATVRAVEAERDAAIARAEKLAALVRELVNECGVTAEEGCYWCIRSLALLAADDAERGDG